MASNVICLLSEAFAEYVEPQEQTGRKEARYQGRFSTGRFLGTGSCSRFPVISQLPWYCLHLLIFPNPTVRLDSQVLGQWFR
jgi:hypothetical protein